MTFVMNMTHRFVLVLCMLASGGQAHAEQLSEDTKAMLAAKFNADERLAQRCDRLHPGFFQAYTNQFGVIERQLDKIGVHRRFRDSVAKQPEYEATEDLEAYEAADPRGQCARCMSLLIEVQQNALKRK